LPHLNPDWFYLSGAFLTQVVLEERLLNGYCSSSHVLLLVACVDMSPTDYRVDNESMLIGGEVCLWTEFADDDSILPRLWSATAVIFTRLNAALPSVL